MTKDQQNMTKDQLRTPQDLRLAIFARLGQTLNQAVQSNFHDKQPSMIWAVNDMIPYVDSTADVNVTSLQFACKIGGHEFKYSISLNLGEIRIGILIPISLQNGSSAIHQMDNIDAYDYKSQYSPAKTLRLLPEGLLLDHIFNNRFAMPEIMFQVFCSSIEDDRKIYVLADAIAKELIHINHALMHALTEKGFLITDKGIFNPDEKTLMPLNTMLAPEDILINLDIKPQQLLTIDINSYFINFPKEDAKLADKINALNKQ